VTAGNSPAVSRNIKTRAPQKKIEEKKKMASPGEL
jgi:hypothetical protein